jgi:membrane protease YdiL (CAAX protease family)
MSVTNAVLSALLQVLVLGGIPFLAYVVYHRRRHRRSFRDICQRAGLQLGPPRYLLYSGLLAVASVIVLVVWTPPLEPLLRQGSSQARFVGLGLTPRTIVLALLYGVVQTGFTEELVFRGLIAGSLGRRLSEIWANVVQAVIFLLPHFAVLLFAPEFAPLLAVIFVLSLVLGWLRLRSGSMLGPWLIHAAGNVSTALIVAARTAS